MSAAGTADGVPGRLVRGEAFSLLIGIVDLGVTGRERGGVGGTSPVARIRASTALQSSLSALSGVIDITSQFSRSTGGVGRECVAAGAIIGTTPGSREGFGGGGGLEA